MATRPNNVSLTGVGALIIPVNRFEDSTTVQIAVTGTATWTLKWTLANVMRGDTPAWAEHPDGAATGTGAGEVIFDFPFTALQLAITAGDGTVSAIIIQALC